MDAKLKAKAKKALGSVGQSAVQGEPFTGYENGDKGEFECENCHFFDPSDSSCGQKVMVARSKQPLLKNGRRQVDPEGCCEYVKRIGRAEDAREDE